ncbi:alpha/beta hydrolase [Streptomyces sulfonofaciens]|uniref:Alpha/beta hydrolase n=1 Tax=Streptomyces sulfonofaciens TaxID=68272 RepID=A0A919GMN1_9ACTN|nr:alpha/beta hydrolase [Streptomyces sulfonofaciens]GHH87635.1 alpha/beta hydrolase [Streptomyces sulfonofaciens]
MNVASPKRSTSVRRGAAAGAGILALTVAGVLTLNSTASATDPHGTRQKPTIVLEHGAFADASSWSGVIQRLERDGYPVVAAANPLRSVAGDAAYLRGVVDRSQGPVILVGHSYGGSVISEAATNDPKVKALVYAAAFLPAAGESAGELSGKFPGSTLGAALDPVPYTLPDGAEGTDLYIRADKFRHQFAADVPANQAALMAATQRPVTQAALDEKATSAAWRTKPSWDLITTRDLNIPVAAQEFMAERAHAHVTKVDSSHAVAVSHPDTVTRVIEQAARATAE